MKSLIKSTNSLIVKPSDKFILKCGYSETELDAREYALVDSLLQAIMAGQVNAHSFYRCKRTGETFNLAHFSYLIRKNDPNGFKVWGEDLRL